MLSPAFRKFIKAIRPSFTPPSRPKLSNELLDEAYYRKKEEVDSVLSQAKHISIVTDGWTNPRAECIINYLATADDKCYFIKSVATKMDRHNKEYIASGIEEVVEQLGKERVVGCTTDNAANMKSSWPILKAKYPKLVTLGCCSHTLNLLGNDIMKLPEVVEVWEKALEVAKWFKRHSLATAMVKDNTAQNEKFAAFQLPGKTRWQGKVATIRALRINWRSMQRTMLGERLLGPSAAAREKETAQGIRTIVLDDHFKGRMQMLEDLLAPFLQICIALETERPRLSKVYYYLTWLQKQTTISSLVPKQTFFPLVQKRMQQAYHPMMCIAYLADPNVRKEKVVKVTQSQIEQAVQWLQEEYCNGSTEAAGAYLALLIALRDKTGIFGNQIRWAAAPNMHPRHWWTLWEEDLPEMAELCMRALSILPTSGDAERNWSEYGHIHSLKRNRLDLDRAEKLVYLHHNLRIDTLDPEPNKAALLEAEMDPEEEDEAGAGDEGWVPQYIQDDEDEQGVVGPLSDIDAP